MTKHADYVIIRGEVFRWEEKAPFMASGKSTMGAIEYNKETDKIKCHECGKWFKHLPPHLPKHDIDTSDYKSKHGLRQGSALSCEGYRSSHRTHLLQLVDNGKLELDIAKFQDLRQSSRARFGASRKEFINVAGTCPVQTITKLQALFAKLGRTPTWGDASKKLVCATIHRYGSWRNGLKAAGLKIYNEHPPYSRIILRDMLIDFYVLNKRLPKSKDWGKGRLAGRSTYQRFFGSVQAAYEDAGLGLVHEQQYGQKSNAAD